VLAVQLRAVLPLLLLALLCFNLTLNASLNLQRSVVQHGAAEQQPNAVATAAHSAREAAGPCYHHMIIPRDALPYGYAAVIAMIACRICMSPQLRQQSTPALNTPTPCAHLHPPTNQRRRQHISQLAHQQHATWRADGVPQAYQLAQLHPHVKRLTRRDAAAECRRQVQRQQRHRNGAQLQLVQRRLLHVQTPCSSSSSSKQQQQQQPQAVQRQCEQFIMYISSGAYCVSWRPAAKQAAQPPVNYPSA
jgi:hypothetical protein